MLNIKKLRFLSNRPIGTLRYCLSDIVYGATDGVITTFTIISGVEGARFAPKVAIILGLVNLLADGLSMGASRFLSYRAETAAHLFQLQSHGYREPLNHGLATFLAFVLLGGIPLISFFIPDFSEHRFSISCIMTMIVLLLIGILRAFITKERWLRSMFEMLVIGGFVAALAYAAGHTLSHAQWIK
jgi:VIT1/CCC1 family predicted Fe2+/Mn2+ transporter